MENKYLPVGSKITRWKWAREKSGVPYVSIFFRNRCYNIYDAITLIYSLLVQVHKLHTPLDRVSNSVVLVVSLWHMFWWSLLGFLNWHNQNAESFIQSFMLYYLLYINHGMFKWCISHLSFISRKASISIFIFCK